ncbi:MAG: helix-turn-helix domain-containing protein, partial [Stackebrandtia sp.]
TRIRGHTFPLTDVMPDRQARELAAAAAGDATAADLVRNRWQSAPVDRRVDRLIDWLARDQDANPDRLTVATGLSSRQLRRLLWEHAGVGPKALQRVFRLHRFLRLAERPGPPPRLAGLAAAAGYVDQAHLNSETKKLSGLSPAALLRRRAGG